jgi:hypothetical protein
MAASDIFLGFDPSGQRDFRVAVLDGAEVQTATVISVSAAIGWFVERCGSKEPVGAGIDTLLYWCDGTAGRRDFDQVLHQAYPAAPLDVLGPYGLTGRMIMGGMAMALRLRQRWPGIRLNEAHPNVLAFTFRQERHRDGDLKGAVEWMAGHSGLNLTRVQNGGELNAVLAAWATREGLSQGWFDCVVDDPAMLFPAGKVSYLWPSGKATNPT